MKSKESGEYLTLDAVRKVLHVSSITIIRVSQTIQPPLDTIGSRIHKGEIERLKDAIPVHMREIADASKHKNKYKNTAEASEASQ